MFDQRHFLWGLMVLLGFLSLCFLFIALAFANLGCAKEAWVLLAAAFLTALIGLVAGSFT